MRILAALILAALAGLPAVAQEDPDADKVLPHNEATLQAILHAAGESNRDVRTRVAWVLSRLVQQDTLTALETLAQDPAPEVRAAALRAMGRMLPAGRTVRVKLEVPVADPSLRTAALAAARTLLFDQRLSLLQHALRQGSVEEKELAVQALALDPPSVSAPHLQAALRDEHPVVRRAAVLAIARSGNAAAAAQVAAAFADKQPIVRAAACQAVAMLKSAEGREHVFRAVSDEHFYVRRCAVQALAALGDNAAAGAVQSRIDEPDCTVREAACAALGALIHPSSPPFLADRLADEVPEVRKAAADALAGFPPEMAHAAVLKYVEDQRTETRRIAWWVLGEYGFKDNADLALAHIEDKDPDVRGYAMRILRKVDDRRIVPHVVKMLSTAALEKAADLEASEALIIAGHLQIKEPVPSAIRILKLTVNPPLEPPWMPTQGMVRGSVEYLAAINHKPAISLIQSPFEISKQDRELGPVCAAALEKLTGRKYELSFATGPQKGTFFITVNPAMQPGPGR